jgi:hypothetical protein
MEKVKLNWLGCVEKAFGSCAKIVFADGSPIGFVQYALPKHFPRVGDYASGPPSEDARARATAVLKNLLKELNERGFRAVETFARVDSANNPSGPLAFYLKHGFKVVQQKDDFPLVRLELKES